MADISVSSPEDTDLVSAYPADERASRAALLALTSGTMFGGGTTGGSANAQTLTISNTGLTLTTGLRGSFIAGFTVSSAAATLQINSLTAKTMVTPANTAIYSATGPQAGVLSGNRYDWWYDGTSIVIANPSHYVDQGVYNLMHPVGSLIININVSAPVVPLGCTATWTRLTTDQYLRIASGSPTAGGTLVTSGESGLHTHTVTPVPSTIAIGDITIGSGTTVVTSVPAITSGTESASHTHDFTPTFRSFAVYFRAS